MKIRLGRKVWFERTSVMWHGDIFGWYWWVYTDRYFKKGGWRKPRGAVRIRRIHAKED